MHYSLVHILAHSMNEYTIRKKKIVFVKDAAHLLFHESTQVLVEEMKKFIQNII